ncbi:YhdP family protein [Ramlibacter sp.]|uniref:YhdP family protein n=1 Tax=Ramlibacter sp. TaxID=1917967 RepID=UPI002CD6FAA0|nr:YhdP family protein [Ramlibacter sp.]HWI84022.1 YhdP family protein [Ramlibacter sp.]
MYDSPTPSRPLKALAAVAKWSLWLLLGAWLVLVLAWGALHGWIVPRIGELRPQLELEAGRVLGVPVRIGSIAARTEGLVPSFELENVVLLDPQGRPALRLPRVLAALSPRSLWNLGFEQLLIERPELDIRRAADGRLFVAGLDFSRGHDDGRAADWFFRQTEFVIREGIVRWTDERRGAPPLALAGVDFVMRNSARRHALRIDATPPAEWGERFTLRGIFRQPLLSVHAGRWQEWDGQLHGDFARVDVSQLRRYADFGVEVAAGHGSVRAWADVDHGQLAGGVADVVLADVNSRLAPQLAPLALQYVAGRIGGKRLAGGFELQTEGLQFETLEGQRWPGGNLFVRWTQAEGRQPARGELRADRLDLLALSQIAARLPLGDATHAALAAYAPRGVVETIQASWQGPLDDLQQYAAKGRAAGLEIAARPAAAPPGAPPRAGTPGVRGASLDFDLTQSGGKGKLGIRKGAVEVPGVFEDPLVAIDELAAELQWKINGQAIDAAVTNLRFANADAQGEGRATWRTAEPAAGRFPGVLDLQASLSRANGARVHRYLPLGVPKTARDYVREAVVQGTATGAKFRVKGNLRDFPFADPKLGEFKVTADVRDVTYAYVPRSVNRNGALPWPAFTQLSGELVFEGNGLQVKGASGRIAGAPALQFKADARIPDLRTTTVSVTGDIRGPLTQALGVVTTSPIASFTSHALDRATATGNAEVKLNLVLPIAKIEQSKVQGSVTLAANDLQITPDSPVLARARGVVTFSETGFALAGAQARALGGEVRLEGGSRGQPGVALPANADATILLRAQGTASADGLRLAKELGFVSRLARDASGAAAYQLLLAFRRGVPEITLTSNLQGLALNLPPPLNKAADAALPLRYENVLVRDGAAAPKADQIAVEVGRLASIVYVRDLSAGEPRVVRGAIGVGLAAGEAAPLGEQGVAANINFATLNLDAWQGVLSRAAGDGAAASPARPAAAGAAPAAGYLPTTMAVRARELTMAGRTLHDVVVGGSRDGQLWRANVDARELNGFVEYRQPSGAGAGRLYARLARLAVAAAAASEVESLLDQQPETLPALDIVVDDFELKGKKLGHLEIDAVNRGPGVVAREGGVREWRLNKLRIAVPEAEFSATGNWAALNAQAAAPGGPRPARPAGERRRTVMNFKLEIADAGQLLARFGMKDIVRRGRGRMDGQVAWLGSPLSLDYPSLNGGFFINVESGQFLKADPGLAKLLGVLSLQSLPRRLALDFRDVFTEGFAFDFVRGDITIEQGIAATNNLQMKGVNAAVLMEGRADIARETQDIKVVVVPEINAGTASLVATMINPAIGLGSFLAQLFLRQPLIRAATQEFHVDGTWADPRVTRVGRGAAAPEAGGAARGRSEAARESGAGRTN